MKQARSKAFSIVFEGLSFGEKIKNSIHKIWCFKFHNKNSLNTHMWHDTHTVKNAYRQLLMTQLNHFISLVKWLSVCLGTKWLWVQILLLSLKFLILNLFRATSLLIFTQFQGEDSLNTLMWHDKHTRNFDNIW